MSNLYLRGSEWRKWDLHVHTPASALNNGFGDDWDIFVKTLFNRAIKNNIACIGLTDYFSIDGYKKVRDEYLCSEMKLKELFADELQADSEYIDKIKSILVIPNIEIRLRDIIVTDRENGHFKNSKLEYHLILNNNLTTQQIEDNILGQLHFNNQSSVHFGSDTVPLTKNNLMQFGAKLKSEQSEFAAFSDYLVGCMCASIDFSSLIQTLRKTSNELYDNCILVLVEDDITKIAWDDSAHQIRKGIYANSHLLFSANPKTISWGLLKTTKDEFSSYKGCIWGSDAHDYQNLFLPSQNRYCWIKADPTFDGLKQVVIHPGERVYIGAIPPSLDNVEKNKSKYISELKVAKNDNAQNSEKWFDFTLLLNPGLVAVIGNKGSGKSALSDIIGYIGHSSAMQFASFLHKSRFQREDKKYAEDYTGTLTWFDGHAITEKNLYKNENDAIGEYVKYLPQKYIETVCGNIDNEFQDEINSVIFSYIDKSIKGDALNLKELIEKKCSSIYNLIGDERKKLDIINRRIIALEDKKAPKFKNQCEQRLKQLEEEYTRIHNNSPKEVSDPNKTEDIEKAQRVVEIDKLLTKVETEISESNISLSHIHDCIYEISDIQIIAQSIEQSIEDLNNRFSALPDCQFSQPLLSLSRNDTELNKLIMNYESSKQQISKRLEPVPDNIEWNNTSVVNELRKSLKDSLNFKKASLEYEKQQLVLESSVEQQIYEKYRSDIKDWQDALTKVLGDAQTEDSINYYKFLLTYISEQLDQELSSADDARTKCMKSIYENYQKITAVLTELYLPVKDKLSAVLRHSDEIIEFSADIVECDDLSEEIVEKINKRSKGRFYGISNTRGIIDELIRSSDFSEWSGFQKFFNGFLQEMRNNYDELPNLIQKREEFYSFLTDMRYISPEYTLKMDGKTIDELSPGERGLVLLVFYLALSKDSKPLIVDQPEDNLDNQSVYNRLVPCILEAKRNRQVIIVTHNPNIAVACDAEQIIFCDIDKTNMSISYSPGSIESAFTRNRVIDVLEGTEPAFDLRKSKYYFDFLSFKRESDG